ncbi:hypothetical protein DJICPGNB_12780 [Escherichia coli]|nr:hypothetical protein DJICPGNB_12780 [Escherichia coli]
MAGAHRLWVASVLMALMALALWRGLPQMKSETHLNYPQLLVRFQHVYQR